MLTFTFSATDLTQEQSESLRVTGVKDWAPRARFRVTRLSLEPSRSVRATFLSGFLGADEGIAALRRLHRERDALLARSGGRAHEITCARDLDAHLDALARSANAAPLHGYVLVEEIPFVLQLGRHGGLPSVDHRMFDVEGVERMPTLERGGIRLRDMTVDRAPRIAVEHSAPRLAM